LNTPSISWLFDNTAASKTPDPALGRDCRDLLEHPRTDPTALIIIGHRKRHLRDAGLTQP
jgi:hypothetical protein